MGERKVLFVATVVKTHINVFHLPYLKMLKEMGYTTYVAAKNDFIDEPCVIPYCDIYIDIPFAREPFSSQNITAYKVLKKLIEKEKFDIIHCHTPVGGVLARLAARKARKSGTKVIYTAHGFHFYKGAPLKNWLFYYPAEKICSFFTDVLITINKEDYVLAQKKMKAKKIEYVPGVGIDLEKYSGNTVDKETERKELGIPVDSILLLSVGELNENKNHETVIRALSAADNKNIYYIIAGRGNKKDRLEELIRKSDLEERIKLIGYRTDTAKLYSISDIFVFPSYREGLSLSLMEAMASGIPVVCSRIRGNTDLIDEGKGGIMFDPHSVEECKCAIKKILESNLEKFGTYNKNKIRECDVKKISLQIKEEYMRTNVRG